MFTFRVPAVRIAFGNWPCAQTYARTQFYPRTCNVVCSWTLHTSARPNGSGLSSLRGTCPVHGPAGAMSLGSCSGTRRIALDAAVDSKQGVHISPSSRPARVELAVIPKCFIQSMFFWRTKSPIRKPLGPWALRFGQRIDQSSEVSSQALLYRRVTDV
ncbi:hypothetical protein K458DRAFT_49615 [Lentithecium fluviatile CBS 122367]|uniref:Uncharacterized protein n=1 Tax=Lentithecium fluviatile CBS 122367 TaxID=1168545 RepID=A0A6G1IY26_9PLEO|nr:hypothetical protein K458DRAFT_49615 [Lentithecium fluviatile CBS 122367]